MRHNKKATAFALTAAMLISTCVTTLMHASRQVSTESEQKIALSQQDTELLCAAGESTVVMIGDAGTVFFHHLQHTLNNRSAAEQELKKLCSFVATGNRMLDLDDVMAAVVYAHSSENATLLQLALTLIDTMQPYRMHLTNSPRECDAFVCSDMQSRAIKPFQTITATLKPPRRELINGSLFITHGLCVQGDTSIQGNISTDNLCLSNSLSVDNIFPKTGSIINIDGSLNLTGGNLNMNGFTIIDGAGPVNVDDDLCITGTVQLHRIEPKDKNIVIDASTNLSSGGSIVIDSSVTAVSGQGGEITIDTSATGDGSMSGAIKLDAHTGNCSTSGAITLDTSSGDDATSGAITLDTRSGGLATSGAITLDASSGSGGKGGLIHLKTIGAFATEIRLEADEVCVTGTLRTDSLHCKNNDHIDVDCRLDIDDDLCITGTVQLHRIEPKDKNIVIDASTNLSSGGSIVIDSSVTAVSGQGGEITIDTSATGDGSMSGAIKLDAHTGNCSTSGAITLDTSSGDDATSGAITLDTRSGGLATSGAITLDASSGPGGEGGLIHLKTIGAFATEIRLEADEVCVTGTLRTDSLHCKNNDHIDINCGLEISGIVAIDDDLCTTGTLRTDALFCKDNGEIEVNCDIDLNGNMINDIATVNAIDACLIGKLQANTIEAKTGDLVVLNDYLCVNQTLSVNTIEPKSSILTVKAPKISLESSAICATNRILINNLGGTTQASLIGDVAGGGQQLLYDTAGGLRLAHLGDTTVNGAGSVWINGTFGVDVVAIESDVPDPLAPMGKYGRLRMKEETGGFITLELTGSRREGTVASSVTTSSVALFRAIDGMRRFVAFGVTGDVFANQYLPISDDRIKTEETPVDTQVVLDRISTLTVHTYKWEESYHSTPLSEQPLQYGLVAQELKQVFPEVVDTSQTMTLDGVYIDDVHHVNYSQLTSIALAGIQELDKRFGDNNSTTTFDADVLMTGNLKVDGVFVNPSDLRIKKDIAYRTPSDSLDCVLNLKPCSYKYTQEFKGIPVQQQEAQLGFIAQEVATVIPELVKVTSTKSVGDQKLENFMSLDYTRFVVDLVGACQELQAQLEYAQSERDDLKNGLTHATEQIELLKEELATLKK